MDIQTKHRVTLLNAKCNYVCAVDTLVQKSNYGEDIGCCIEKLYLASRIINRLECFCFETPVTVTTEILSVFTFPLANNNYQDGDILQLMVNGVQVGGGVSVGAEYKPTFWINLLASLDIPTTTEVSGGNTIFTSTFDCNVTEILVYTTRAGVTTIATPTNSVAGACATSNPPCYNCIENSDLNKMYEVLHKLLQ